MSEKSISSSGIFSRASNSARCCSLSIILAFLVGPSFALACFASANDASGFTRTGPCVDHNEGCRSDDSDGFPALLPRVWVFLRYEMLVVEDAFCRLETDAVL